MSRLDLVLALAVTGCAPTPAFVGTTDAASAADTTSPTDTASPTDGASSVPDADTGSPDTTTGDGGDVETTTCSCPLGTLCDEGACVSCADECGWGVDGRCGRDSCGGTCGCVSGSACGEDGTCACIVGCVEHASTPGVRGLSVAVGPRGPMLVYGRDGADGPGLYARRYEGGAWVERLIEATRSGDIVTASAYDEGVLHVVYVGATPDDATIALRYVGLVEGSPPAHALPYGPSACADPRLVITPVGRPLVACHFVEGQKRIMVFEAQQPDGLWVPAYDTIVFGFTDEAKANLHALDWTFTEQGPFVVALDDRGRGVTWSWNGGAWDHQEPEALAVALVEGFHYRLRVVAHGAVRHVLLRERGPTGAELVRHHRLGVESAPALDLPCEDCGSGVAFDVSPVSSTGTFYAVLASSDAARVLAFSSEAATWSTSSTQAIAGATDAVMTLVVDSPLVAVMEPSGVAWWTPELTSEVGR